MLAARAAARQVDHRRVGAGRQRGGVRLVRRAGSGPTLRRDKPHVIVIGLDSLRPDALRRRRTAATPSPAINEFLADSVVFSDTLTPLARTFPSWGSIVSGKHPHTTGAVMNLLTRELIDEGDTLPKLLANAGYHTVYATDEVRFSNLDQTYGFEEMIAPPMGAADFLVGFFSDSPLANLLVNTAAGELLFPYAYANRAVAVTYDPDMFVEQARQRPAVRRADASRGPFDARTLALHVGCDAARRNPGSSELPCPKNIGAQSTRLDQQFGDLVNCSATAARWKTPSSSCYQTMASRLGEPAGIADDEHAIRHINRLDRFRRAWHERVRRGRSIKCCSRCSSFGGGRAPDSRGNENHGACVARGHYADPRRGARARASRRVRRHFVAS